MGNHRRRHHRCEGAREPLRQDRGDDLAIGGIVDIAGETGWFQPLVGWLLWPGVAMMVTASLTSFFATLLDSRAGPSMGPAPSGRRERGWRGRLGSTGAGAEGDT